MGVRADVRADEAADSFAHQGPHGLGQLLATRARVNGGELGSQGSRSGGVDCLLVEELGPQGRDAPSVGILQGAGGGILSDVAGVLLGGVAQRVKGPVHRAIRRDRVGREPGAVDVTVEVVLGAHGGVDVRGLEDSGQQCVRHALTVGGGRRSALRHRCARSRTNHLRDGDGSLFPALPGSCRGQCGCVSGVKRSCTSVHPRVCIRAKRLWWSMMYIAQAHSLNLMKT